MVKNTERSMSVRIYRRGWLRDIEVELENMELMILCNRDQDISGFI